MLNLQEYVFEDLGVKIVLEYESLPLRFHDIETDEVIGGCDVVAGGLGDAYLKKFLMVEAETGMMPKVHKAIVRVLKDFGFKTRTHQRIKNNRVFTITRDIK